MSYTGTKLDYGGNADVHYSKLDDLMATNKYLKHPTGHAQAGLLATEPGGLASHYLLQSLEEEIAADLKKQNGAVDDEKLQVQECLIPDTALAIYKTFDTCNLSELKNAIKRKVWDADAIQSVKESLLADFQMVGESGAVWCERVVRKARLLNT